MRYLKVLLSAAFLVSFVILAGNAATAQTSYTLNVDYCTTGCLFGGTGGTVTLTQVSSTDVRVSVSLTQVDFHDQGLTSFTFNLSGVTGTVSITGAPTGFTSTGAVHEDGAGNFGYSLNCPNCGPQSGGIKTATLTFDVTVSSGTITVADFAQLSSGGSPSAYFAAAVFNTTNSHCTGVIGSNGSTVAVNGGSNDGSGACAGTAVPEPTSLAMLGWTGLIGLIPLVRRKLRI